MIPGDKAQSGPGFVPPSTDWAHPDVTITGVWVPPRDADWQPPDDLTGFLAAGEPPKDRRVLAAAIRGGCQVLVTFNTGDFPERSVAEHGIAVVHPEDFMLDQLDLYPGQVRNALWAQASASSRPSLSYAELLARLRRAGVGAFVEEFRQRFGDDVKITGGEGKRFAPK